ncbi:MAG: DUF3108 domain-containing protein [Oceanicaulis sp.]|nr:DUF3108 domain-containing protein [Oceanicaulis sp.]
MMVSPCPDIGRIFQFGAGIPGRNHSSQRRYHGNGLSRRRDNPRCGVWPACFPIWTFAPNVEGHLTPAGPVPVHYGHNETTPSKTRLLDVDFTENVALAHADPPFGSLGIPPASTADRTGVLDPMTAFLRSRKPWLWRKSGLRGRVPVFDGKQRYNLRLEPGGRNKFEPAHGPARPPYAGPGMSPFPGPGGLSNRS